MATTVEVPRSQSERAPLNSWGLIPGILLLVAVGYAGKFLEKFLNTYAKAHHWTFPNIEYVLWAIVIGLVISNLLSVPKIFQAGIATYEFWLKVGIVLLGSRFILADILKLGGISLALVVDRNFVSPSAHALPRTRLQPLSEADEPARCGIFDLRSIRHHRG